MIFTPRRKLKFVRDYKCFQHMDKALLDSRVVSMGDLEGKQEQQQKEDDDKIFLHACWKRVEYS